MDDHISLGVKKKNIPETNFLMHPRGRINWAEAYKITDFCIKAPSNHHVSHSRIYSACLEFPWYTP